MFIALSLIMLVSCSVYSMDNSPRKEEAQNWISKKELTNKLGYPAAHTLAMVASTPPDKIKETKFPKGALLKATKTTHQKPLDEIFSQEQWEMLHAVGSLAIIDKYRKDSTSTWYLIDEKQEKTDQNEKRKKRDYCYITKKNTRNLFSLQHNKTGHVFIAQDTDHESQFVQGAIEAIPFQHIQIASENSIDIKNEKNAKQLTITWKNDANKDKSQTWRARRAVKESNTFDDYLKAEFCKNIKYINAHAITERNQINNSMQIQSIAMFNIFTKHGVPEAELLGLASRASEGNSENLIAALIQKYVLPTQMESLQKDIQSFHKKQGIQNENDAKEMSDKTLNEVYTNSKNALNLSHENIIKDTNN